MRHIKLVDGTSIDLYSLYTHNDLLNLELLNTSLVDVETAFTETNIESITSIGEDGDIEKIYNGYTSVMSMSKTLKDVSKYYLGTGNIDDGTEEVMVCIVELKLTDELKKQLEIADKKIEELVKTQNDMSTTIDELKSKNEELDEMVAMLLLGTLDEDVSEDETIEEVVGDDTETTEEVSE